MLFGVENMPNFFTEIWIRIRILEDPDQGESNVKFRIRYPNPGQMAGIGHTAENLVFG